VVIWVGTLLVVGLGLYPPWACVGRAGIGVAIGYHWFFAPPKDQCFAANVDFPRLLVQWIIVAVLVGALYCAWPSRFFARLSKEWGKRSWFNVLVFGCLGWLLYIGCETLQPQVELPARWADAMGAPTVNHSDPVLVNPWKTAPAPPSHWLFRDVLLFLMATWFLIDLALTLARTVRAHKERLP